MNTEILLYIEKVKKFFETNIAAKNYFLGDNDEKRFFDRLSEISKNNFNQRGEPELFPDQFEQIRSELMSNLDDKIFVNVSGYGKICLN